MMDVFRELLQFFQAGGATRRLVLLGSVLLGISSGVLGSFAYLRRQSLLGDAMAHAALPGVCLAFLITGSKDPFLILIGAICTGVIGGFTVLGIEQYSRVKYDAAIGMVLSVFFGAGVVLLTVIQQSGAANQAGLETFMFGDAATLMRTDIYIMSVMCVVLLLMVLLFYKEFKLLSFDPEFARSAGFPVRFLDLLLTFLIVVSVMVGLQAVGVVLMAAMLILPAASARQWTDRLGMMILISAGIGALSGASGSVLSSLYVDLPTGPIMVLIAGGILIVSVLFSRNRGVLQAWLQKWRFQSRIRRENFLKRVYKFLEDSGESIDTPFTVRELAEYTGIDPDEARSLIQRYNRQGDFEQASERWKFTEDGRRRATEIVRRHRLWELYLASEVNLRADHVHRDADEMEHLLSDQLIDAIEAELDDTSTDPHGKPIPTPESSSEQTERSPSFTGTE